MSSPANSRETISLGTKTTCFGRSVSQSVGRSALAGQLRSNTELNLTNPMCPISQTLMYFLDARNSIKKPTWSPRYSVTLLHSLAGVVVYDSLKSMQINNSIDENLKQNI